MAFTLMRWHILIFGLIVTLSGCASHVHDQVPDKSYRPPIEVPAYREGTGPVVCLDEAHFNFHTLNGRFWAFGELLRRDGFVVRASSKRFDDSTLEQCDILVISNAQPSDAEWDDYPSPTPSAFTPEEIEATHRWVETGGKLLLIADHMPLAGAAAQLAAAFGITFTDGFAVPATGTPLDVKAALGKAVILRASDQTLRSHAIVRGRSDDEAVPSVRTFVGQAFQIPASAEPILVLPENFISLMPEKPWQFSPEMKTIPVGGWSQGAVMKLGSGRAAFFGEAAMFSAQRVGTEQMGMSAPGAEHNYRFVLNLMRWLSGALPEH